MTASKILRIAADTIEARGKLRDNGQERSMARAVSTFNALTGHALTETQGWTFMLVLKLAREQSAHDPDNWVDATAYAALAAESVSPKASRPPADPPACRIPAADGGLYSDRPGSCPSCEED